MLIYHHVTLGISNIKDKMMNYTTILQQLLNKPKTVYAIVSAMIVLSLVMFPSLQIDTDPENMLSSDDPARVFHNQVKQDFVMHDMIVVGALSQTSVYSVE